MLSKAEFYERFERCCAAVREVCGDEMGFMLVLQSDEWVTGGGSLPRHRVAPILRQLAAHHEAELDQGRVVSPDEMRERVKGEVS